ncbi:MAG: MerR family DNA-binding protein [Acidimicrobiales bacterium]
MRYYEAIDLLPEPQRTPSGYRTYDNDAEDLLTFIKSAQRLGITLHEIREILAFRDRGEEPCAYVRGVMRRQVDQIDRRLAELRRLRKELVALDALADELAPGRAVCRLIDHVRQRPTNQG